ncbi:integral peroxisomal membrane peroxin [Ascobolus immersus RN42]|uniref:Integral peroxisomal membrane peroxin n=1 Tax=Ascobolus immersus RN42 TaxID=1160509 RepID=A0A3N4H9A3_ASCIM|nr:integral peroxisomal membrane peroxin [Ascobolus immersus RN42]
MIPTEYTAEHYAEAAEKRRNESRPPFSIATMGSNFRRFNARVGVVFVLQHRLIRLLQWKTPSHTYAFLAIYFFICLDPSLLAALPFISLLLFLMVPTFIARPPPPPSALPSEPYSAHGQSIAPPIEVKPVAELSREFFRNLRDLQNTMDDFSNAHDALIRKIGPLTNFSDERLSSGVYCFFLALSALLFLTARLFPWRLIFLYHGYLLFALTHPTLQPYLLRSASAGSFAAKEKILASRFQNFTDNAFILDDPPETREIEIFELQRRDSPSSEWIPWLFSTSPYEPLCSSRIAGQRPTGTRFFEDVHPPEGWEFRGKKWEVDLGTEWVQERCITGVEVETEGERWVFDLEGVREGEYEWKRRRWVREVVRKVLV